MTLFTCKVGLELKWPKYCVLPEAGADSNNDNDNDIILTIKKLCFYCNAISKRQSKTIKTLAKNLKNQFIVMIIKQKENNNTANEFRYVPEWKLVGVNRLLVLL